MSALLLGPLALTAQ